MASVVALVPNRRLRYVEDDLRILAGAHDVHVVAREEHASRRQLLPALARHFIARRPDVLWVWFADPYDTPYALLLARAFGIRSVVVAGGYDVASLPAFRYGALTSRAARWQARSALKLADVVLATSHFIEAEVRALGRLQDVRTVHLGVDCERFTSRGPREPLVLTVGHADADAWRLKGLDVFAACSRLVPNLRFVIVGRCSDPAVASALRAAGGPNLTLVERDLDTPELLAWYRRASVYAQLSVRESFGLALAEAMACGCVPVATTAGALPEVVGDTGALVPWGDVPAAAKAIARAAASDDGARAAQRVRDEFPLTARGEEVLATVSALLGAEMPREERRAAG